VVSTDFTVALRAGVDHLYRALERPVEGTILTVMRETAEEAEASGGARFHAALLDRLVARARDALARTPDDCPRCAPPVGRRRGEGLRESPRGCPHAGARRSSLRTDDDRRRKRRPPLRAST
jgi:hypothetical protein